MDTGKIRRKRIGRTVFVKKGDDATKYPKMKEEGGQQMVRTRVDVEGNAYYRPAKEPEMRVVKKSPQFDSNKRKVTKRRWKAKW